MSIRLAVVPLAMLFLSSCPLRAETVGESDPASLGTITVTSAAGFEQAIADAPASISVITRTELEKLPYANITDAMFDIPGVFVTGGGKMQDVSIRGMSPTYTLYLVDGRPISAGRAVNSNGTDGGKQIGLPPLAMIERIEVIRGPMSSLYGSEAMGGVINLITRVTPDAWSGQLDMDYTHAANDVSNDAYTSSFFLGGPLKQDVLGLRVHGGWQHTDESDFAAGSTKADASTPESNRRNLGVKLDWQLNENNRMALDLDHSRLDYTHTPGRSLALTDTGTFYRYDKTIYTLSHNGRYGNLALDTWLQHDVSDRVQEQTKKEQITTFNTQATWFGERHTYTFGGRYKNEEFVDETNGLLTSQIPGAVRSVERWIAAVFAEAEWNLHEDFLLTTGLRLDDDELFGKHYSPRIYGNWRLSENFTLKGGVSTGYTQPALSAVTPGFGRGTGGAGSPAPHPRALIIGNPELDPEQSVNYELGWVHENPDQGFSTSLMAYLTRYKDKIAEDRYCDLGGDRNDASTWGCEFGGNHYLFLSTQKNIDRAEIRGVELTFDWELSEAWKLRGSYSWTDSEQKTGEFVGEPLNKIPGSMANIGVDWTLSDRLGVWGRVNHRGKTSDFLSRTTMESGTPAYTLADIGLRYRINPQVSLKAGLYNLSNRVITNDTYGVVLDGRRVNLGLDFGF